MPTWTLDAFDSKVKSSGPQVKSVGFQKMARQFSLKAEAILRVELRQTTVSTKKRGATWNSLPVVELEFEH